MKLSIRIICCLAVSLLLTSLLVLSSCCHVEQPGVEFTIVDTIQVRVEKEVYQVGEESPKVEAQPVAPSRPVKNTTPSLRRDNDEDNLRGFDPASEDDMPDNGMRRYMENDDEEGWY